MEYEVKCKASGIFELTQKEMEDVYKDVDTLIKKNPSKATIYFIDALMKAIAAGKEKER